MNNLEIELERYLKSYSHDPKSRAFAPLGETYRKMGKLDEAITILEEGVKIHPNYASGYISLGRCYSDKGEMARAVKEFETAIKFAPDNIMAYKLAANEYKKLNDEKSLINTYGKLLKLSSGDQEALSFLSSKGLLKKKDEPVKIDNAKIPIIKTQETVKEPLKFQPNVGTQMNIAVPKTEPKAAVVQPNNPVNEEKRKLEFYTATLAEIYTKQGLKSEAAEIYEVLLENSPSNKNYMNALSRLRGVFPDTSLALDNRLVEQKIEETPRAAVSAVGKLSNLLELIKTRKRSL